MRRIVAFFIALLTFQTALFAAEDISGFWKSVNEEGHAECIFGIYEYDGLYYGRIIGTYNSEGKMDDTIYHPKERAPGVIGKPFYSGLDIVWGLNDSGAKFKGKILDPQKGNIYNCELWINSEGNLVVRGKFLFIGKSRVWLPAHLSDFPTDFQVPDLAEFVPEIPQVK